MSTKVSLRAALVACVAIVTAACADLAAIRQFADISADSAQYTKLAQDYAAGPVRQKRFQPASEHPRLDAAAAARREQLAAITARLSLIEEYMHALGALASDKAPVFDTEIGALGAAVSKAGFAGDAETTAAVTLANLVLRAAADGWRQRQLRELIGQGNAPLQTVIAGLRRIAAEAFLGDLANEQAAARAHYRTLLARSSDPAGKAALEEWIELRQGDMASREAAIKAYDAILKNIAEGHQALYDGRDDISRKALLDQLEMYAKLIQKAAKALT
ncbi:MAG: hypothetical protein AB7P02_01340 [Alphaproteobacteria bacterium]